MNQDKKLYRRFLNGEDEALNEIMEKYKEELVNYINKFIKDYHAAQDVSQEVFVYLLQHREIYKFEYSFRTYLYTIAKSRMINYLKARKNITFIEDNPNNIIIEIRNVEDEIIENDKSARIRKVIKKLKVEYQNVIYLVDLRGLSYSEVAMILGKSVSQIKASLHNARKKLKVLLEAELKREEEHNEINGRIYK